MNIDANSADSDSCANENVSISDCETIDNESLFGTCRFRL